MFIKCYGRFNKLSGFTSFRIDEGTWRVEVEDDLVYVGADVGAARAAYEHAPVECQCAT